MAKVSLNDTRWKENIRNEKCTTVLEICTEFQPGMFIGDDSFAVWFWTLKPFVLC